METNNALNQNPEESEKTTQDENSNPVTDSNDLKKKQVAEENEQATDPPEETPVVSETERPKEQPDNVPISPVIDSEAEETVVSSDQAQENTESPAKEEPTKEVEPAKLEKEGEDQPVIDTPEAQAEVTPAVVDTETEKPVEEVEPAKLEKEKEDQPVIDTPEAQAEVNPAVEDPETEKPAEEIEPEKLEKEEEPVTDPVESKTKEIEVLTDEHDDDEEDDHHDDHHDEHEEELVNYDELGPEELVTLLEEIVEGEEIATLRKKVALIKVVFLKKHKSQLEEQLKDIEGHENEPESPEETKDDLDQRFNDAFKIYSKKRKAYLDQQEAQKQTNLETKKLILEELKALIESEESLKKTYDDFKELQEKWKSVGMVPKSEVNNLWQNYHFYVEKFFDKVKINKELRDLDLKKNLESKIELCEKAEELLLETSILKSFKQLQQYHRQWKEIGPVPQDKKDEIWERFRSTTEKINEARREHYNKLKADQETNLVSKTALCEKAEEVLMREINTIKDWQSNTDEISELLKVWKTIGPAPRKQNDEIWERFKTSLDTFFTGKKEFFQQIKEEQLHNYNLKLDLCAQAEAIKASTDWKTTTRDLINLQKDWKKIGPVPRKHSDKVWHRFRAACDEFFNSKSEYFSNIKSHEADNLKAKEELIRKVEAFEYGEDKNENLEILKGFQREWTEIGHVPFKEKDKVQNTFRNVINDQLDKLKISKAEMQTINYKQRFENIKEKPDSGRILRNEKHFLVQKMKKLEDEIILLENNMGFLAKSKKADLLKAEFTKKIEGAKNEVAVIKEKIKFLEREAE